jgi:hypothetical protein
MSKRALARHAGEQVELVINLKPAKALGLSFAAWSGGTLKENADYEVA